MPPKRKAPTPEIQYEIDGIIRDRTIRGKKEYLVHWLGYTHKDNEWVAEQNMNCEDLLKQFLEKKKSDNPGPVYFTPREEEDDDEASSNPSAAISTTKKVKKPNNEELLKKIREKQNQSSNNTLQKSGTRSGSRSDDAAGTSRLAEKSHARTSSRSSASTSSSKATRANKPEESDDDISEEFEICDGAENPLSKEYTPTDILCIVRMGKKRFAATCFKEMQNAVLIDFDIGKEYENMLELMNRAMVSAPCYAMIPPGEEFDEDEEVPG